MTTFRLDESAGPGTHVFIVGVGAYPHLLGGGGKQVTNAMGMGQLTSPPLSALEILKWTDGELNNPYAPLKSLEVLISQPFPLSFTDKQGHTATIDGATYQNFEDAALAWYTRLSSDPDNVAVFYFCGHGLGDGLNSQLLLEDYGRSSRPLRHAINFAAFRLAMTACKSTRQLFLLDACRVVDPTMLLDPFNMGDSGLPPGNVLTMGKNIANPVIYAARNGEQAFGPPAAVSYFTQALMVGLSSCGVYHAKGSRWSVSPMQLNEAIAAQLDDFTGKPQCPSDGLVGTPFEIHVLTKAPEVVVHVSLTNPAGQASASIRALCSGKVFQRNKPDHPWRTFLPMGDCNVEAVFPAASAYKAVPRSISLTPPWQEIELEVL